MKKLFKKLCIILSIVFILFPIFTMFIWSFIDSYEYPYLLPKNYSLRGWEYVILNKVRVLKTLKTSIFISIMASIITVIISIPCAKALALNEFKGKKLVNYLIYAPVVIPMVSVAMGVNVEFIKLGLSGNLKGIIIVLIVPNIPYSVYILKNTFLIIGRKYIDEAYILGASPFYVLFKIILPMISPGILVSMILCYIVSFSQYFLIYVIGSGRVISFTMDMFPFVSSADRMIGSVYGVIFLISTMVMLFAIKFILNKIYKKELQDYVYM